MRGGCAPIGGVSAMMLVLEILRLIGKILKVEVEDVGVVEIIMFQVDIMLLGS